MDRFTLPEFCNRTFNNGTFSESSQTSGATIISPVLMSLAGLLGNILAVYVLYRNKSQSVFYTLVAGLAWTDLTGILLTCPTPQLKLFSRKSYDSTGYEKKDIEQQTVSL
jgi:Na+/H+-translocating membrane pyrophosphatase